MSFYFEKITGFDEASKDSAVNILRKSRMFRIHTYQTLRRRGDNPTYIAYQHTPTGSIVYIVYIDPSRFQVTSDIIDNPTIREVITTLNPDSYQVDDGTGNRYLMSQFWSDHK